MQVDWLSSDWVIFAVKLSFQSFKLVFGDNFEKCAQLVPEYFSTVFSLAEPLKLTAFKAWMLGSLKCLYYETIKLHVPRPASATPSTRLLSHPLPIPKVWILACSLFTTAKFIIASLLSTSPSVSKKTFFSLLPTYWVVLSTRGPRISVPPKSAPKDRI